MARRTLAHGVVAFAVISLGYAAFTFGEDISAPPYRGSAGSTYQQWDFSSGAAGAPDGGAYSNPYGVPMLDTTGDVTFLAAPDEPGVPPRSGLAKKKKPGTVTIVNTNTGISFAAASSAKFDCIQVTFFGETPTLAVTRSNPSDGFILVPSPPVIVSLSDGWMHATFRNEYVPNPEFTGETYIIDTAGTGTLWIDSIIIDTLAVPEPSAITCIGIGVLALRRRAR